MKKAAMPILAVVLLTFSGCGEKKESDINIDKLSNFEIIVTELKSGIN